MNEIIELGLNGKFFGYFKRNKIDSVTYEEKSTINPSYAIILIVNGVRIELDIYYKESLAKESCRKLAKLIWGNNYGM